MLELAKKHGVGFFDVSSDNGDILFPENGKLKVIDNSSDYLNEPINEKVSKPWWKLW
jgi:hypothetical protein